MSNKETLETAVEMIAEKINRARLKINLNPGSYELRYKSLYENREAEVGTKSEAFQLTQRETYEGISYSVSTITLYKVANGNFRSTSINANDI